MFKNQGLPESEMNPRGFFQDIEFDSIFINEPKTRLFKPNPDPIPEFKKFQVIDFIKMRCQEEIDWGLKSFNLIHVFQDIYKELPSDSKFIITKRRKRSVIKSIEKWFYLGDLEYSEKLYDTAITLVDNIQETLKKKQTYILDYDKMIENVDEELNNLCSFLNKKLTREAYWFVDESLKRS